MAINHFTSDALLLIGHGSSRYPDAGRTLQHHATAIRAACVFAEVGVGFLAGSPSATDALAALSAPQVHVVPWFMEDGYFTRTAVPRALGLDAASSTGSTIRRIRYLPPIGTHASMPEVIEAWAASRCRDLGVLPADLTLLLVGHGSSRAPGRLTALHRHAETLRTRQPFREVHTAFLEEPPLVAETLASLRTPPVGVLGFFAGEGGHVRDDLPALIAEAQRRARPDAGTHPAMVDLGTIGDAADLQRIILDIVASDMLAAGTAGPGMSRTNWWSDPDGSIPAVG